MSDETKSKSATEKMKSEDLTKKTNDETSPRETSDFDELMRINAEKKKKAKAVADRLKHNKKTLREYRIKH